jgi:hypothetical protein
MKNVRLRRWHVGVFGLLAVPLVVASVAWACAALKTLSVNPGDAAVGQTVHGTGRGFSDPHGGTGATYGDVVVRFGSTRGQEVARVTPAKDGTVTFSFVVPNVGPGSYPVIASQTDANGQESPGGLARASLTVTASPAAPASQLGAAPEQGSAAPQRAGAGRGSPAARTAPAGQTAPAAQAGGASAPAAGPAAAGAPAGAPAGADVAAPAGAGLGQPLVGGRSARVGEQSDSPALALALVGAGVILTLVAAGLVISGRREEAAPAAWARRR